MKPPHCNMVFVAILVLLLQLGGCARALLPTSLEEFKEYSYKSEAIIAPVDYITAYANIKNMYMRCFDINTGSTYLSPHGLLNWEKGSATIKLHGNHGTILHVIEIEMVGSNESSISVAIAKNKLIDRRKSLDEIKNRIKNWADGSLRVCP